jgi:LmbE family N-acetylglucosaminyl deacetylase
MRLDGTGPVVVLSPHLDDALFSLWSVVSGAGDVAVVNVCTGIPPPEPVPRWDRVTGATDSAEHMRLRLAEDREALAHVGRDPVGLGLLDAHYGRPSVTASEVVRRTGDHVEEASVLYAPAALGGHADHRATREAAFRIVEGSGIPLRLYADFPYAVRFGWPHWVSGEPRELHRAPDADWELWLADVPCGPAHLRPRVRRLSEAEASARLLAMRLYRTQFAATNGGPIGRLENSYALRFEVVWEVSIDGAT